MNCRQVQAPKCLAEIVLIFQLDLIILRKGTVSMLVSSTASGKQDRLLLLTGGITLASRDTLPYKHHFLTGHKYRTLKRSLMKRKNCSTTGS